MNQFASGSSRLARWSLWLGLAAVVLPVIGALGTRLGLWSFNIGLLFAPGSLIPAAVGLILGLIALLWRRKAPDSRTTSRTTAAMGAAISLLAVSYLSRGVLAVFSYPVIHNISTDIEDPPQFVAAYELRVEGENPLAYDSEVIGPLQREGYPDLGPLELPLPQGEVYERVISVLDDAGLEIVRGDRDSGEIEAVATTFWFGFKDDVAIRLREVDTGTRLDIRSVSRVGASDLGVNADRIREIISRVEAAP